MQSAWRTLVEDIELMPKDQDFGFQPPLRLKAVAQHADEEEGNAIVTRNHVLIRLPPSLPRMEFSEATTVRRR
jgi:hypothetical protein